KLFDIGRDDAKILRDHRHIAEMLSNGHEDLTARRFHPLSVFSCRIPAGHFPGRREAAEMVDADHVYLPECGRDPGGPPAESIGPHRLPIVDRIAPQLARL